MSSSEILKIAGSSNNSATSPPNIIIHTKDKDIDTQGHIGSIDVIRDYINNVGSVIFIRVALLGGDLEHVNRSDGVLEATVKYGWGISVRYRCLIPTGDADFDGLDKLSGVNDEVLNRELTIITFQLVDVASELLQSLLIQPGVIDKDSPKKILNTVIPSTCDKVTIYGKKMIDEYVIEPPTNESFIDQLLIPMGVSVAKLPHFLQDKGSGVYKGGINVFLQRVNLKAVLFIYSPYDYAMKPISRTVTIIVSEEDDITDNYPNTYTVDDKELRLIGNVKSYNNKINDNDPVNTYMSAHVEQIIRSPVVASPGEDVSTNGNLVGESFMSRVDGLSLISSDNLHDNRFKSISNIAKDIGSRMDVVWNQSDSRFITPGMIATVIFFKGTTRSIVKGRVVHMHATTVTSENGIQSYGTYETTLLTLKTQSYKLI